jgi:paraquat-inducible protein A
MYNQPIVEPALIACRDCDLLQRLPELAPGASARCPRCDKELWRRRKDSLNRTLALAVASAVLYVIANSVPMLGLTIVGREASTTVLGGAIHLWNDGPAIVGVLVLLTAVIAPALQIGFMLAIVLGAIRQSPPRWVGTLLRHQPTTRTWSMIEVMMLGVLVALVKIADYATVIPGLALFVLGMLVFLLAGMQSSFDSREVWERIEWAEGGGGAQNVAVGDQAAKEATRVRHLQPRFNEPCRTATPVDCFRVPAPARNKGSVHVALRHSTSASPTVFNAPGPI